MTREQLAAFLFTYAGYCGEDVSGRADITVYADYENVGKWARNALSWAVDAGIITGTGGNVLSPKASATRAQVAQMVMKFTQD